MYAEKVDEAYVTDYLGRQLLEKGRNHSSQFRSIQIRIHTISSVIFNVLCGGGAVNFAESRTEPACIIANAAQSGRYGFFHFDPIGSGLHWCSAMAD